MNFLVECQEIQKLLTLHFLTKSSLCFWNIFIHDHGLKRKWFWIGGRKKLTAKSVVFQWDLTFYWVFSQEVRRKSSEIQRIFIKPPINWRIKVFQWSWKRQISKMMSLKTTFMTFYRTSCHHRTNKSNTLASTTFSHLVNFFLFGIIIILICIVFYVFNNHVKLELFVSNSCRWRNRVSASLKFLDKSKFISPKNNLKSFFQN